MKLVKAFFAGLIGLAVFVLLLSLLFPAHPRVQRTVLISGASEKSVMQRVADLRAWPRWHPLFTSGAVRIDATPTAGALRGHARDKSIQFILQQSDSTAAEILIRAAGERDIRCRISCTPVPGMEQLRVDWVATHELAWYPWQKFYAIFIDQLAGPGYEAALQGLQQDLARHP